MSMIPIRRGSKGNRTGTTGSLPRRLDIADLVHSIVNKALKTSTEKMGLRDIKALIQCIKTGDPVACSYCHYNIAKELGEVLGGLDSDVKAVYAYDFDDNLTDINCAEKASPFSPIHMIIWAGRKTKALSALVESIDRALVQHQRRLLDLSSLEHILDIQFIDDEDVRARTGYAALLKSIYQPPIEVWRSGQNT
ncbi:MAG: hypothetical protein WC541_05585 [Dehalococcoidia bacterium]